MPSPPLLRWLWAFAVVACNGVTIYAQPLPPRDRPVQQTGTGTIKGRVVDAQSGSAVPRARVRISGPQLMNPPPVLTDDLGRFEFTSLVAGRFFLTADKAGYGLSRYPEQGQTIRGGNRPLMVGDHETVANLIIPLYRGAAITGRVIDMHGDPVENAMVQAFRVPARARGTPAPRQNTSTNDLGEFRLARLEPGSYLLLVSPRNPPDDPSLLQSAPTYFPGAASTAEAQPITIERAQTVAGVEIIVGEASAAAVSGTVIDANGQPLQGFAFVNARRVSDTFRDYGGVGAQVRGGTFTMHLTPGEYELETRGLRPGVMGSPRPGDELFGLLHLSMTAVPISDLTIQLAPGAVITGRIVFDGQASAPDDPQAVRITLGGVMPNNMCNQGRSEVFADWTFRIDGAMGTCSMMPAAIGRWTMKSAGRDDSNLLDQQVRFAPGQVLRDVQVVFTDRRTELTLDVTDDHGLRTRDFVAVVFPRDRKRWTENSRYVRLYVPPPPPSAPVATGAAAIGAAPPARPDTIAGLPPGDYYVAVLEDLPVEGNRDAAVLESLAPAATRITLTEEAPVRVALSRRPALPQE